MTSNNSEKKVVGGGGVPNILHPSFPDAALQKMFSSSRLSLRIAIPSNQNPEQIIEQ
jgi:hypothetical protein